MAKDIDSNSSGDKSFFSTLPGIITAIAGLITALGGFILILNKTGCISSKTQPGSNKEQQVVKNEVNDEIEGGVSDDADSGKTAKGSVAANNISYNPKEIKVVLKSVTFRISSADIQSLPNNDKALNIKVKCINESKYEYHFYSYNMRIKIGEDNYASEPNSPSNSYESVPAYGFKNLEYIYKLPANTKTFNLAIYDEKEEMGSAAFTLK